jgi:hypothetical protein
MTLAYASLGFGRTGLVSNGTGEAIITMTGNFSSSQNTFTSAIPSTSSGHYTKSGKFWFGICNGIGVQLDLSADTVARITLNDDGSVRTVLQSVSYAHTTDYSVTPTVFMAWCPSIDCDRIIIGGVRDVGNPPFSSPPWSACTLMDLVEQPFGSVKLAFGTTVPASSLEWLVGAVCASGVCPCVPVVSMLGMVTPSRAALGFAGSLSFNPGAPPGSVSLSQTNPFANFSTANHIQSPRMVDPNGNDYCYGCVWGGSYPFTNIASTTGTCVPSTGQAQEDVIATLNPPSTPINTPVSLSMCIDVNLGLSAAWNFSVSYTWQKTDGGGNRYSYTVLVIYQGTLGPGFSGATFTPVQIGHLWNISPGVPATCSHPCNGYNWIDPASWPNVNISWITSTAPACVTSGGGGSGVNGSTNWTAVSSGGPLAGVGAAALIWQITSSTCTGAFLPTEPAFYPPSLGATTTTYCA